MSRLLSNAIEGMCCDCLYGGEKCCDYSENPECEFYQQDGKCWIPYDIKGEKDNE